MASFALVMLVGVAGGTDGRTGPGLVRAQVGGTTESGPASRGADPDERSEDRAAVRAAMQSFLQAFKSGNADAMADHWTVEGEYHHEGEGVIRGREALREGFAEYFAKTPEVQADVAVESLRFLGRDNAIEEGYVTVRSDPSEPAVTSRYSALLVREDGRWRLALLHEGPGEPTPSLRDLDWLVGDWQATGPEAEVRTTYSWDENRRFLHVRFTIKETDRTHSGFQVLGIDPATGALRAWTFEAEGGLGDAVWIRDGDHWVVEAHGTLADGSTLTATNILRRIDDDTFTWQSTNRRLDDDELPDLAPIKVTRVKPEP